MINFPSRSPAKMWLLVVVMAREWMGTCRGSTVSCRSLQVNGHLMYKTQKVPWLVKFHFVCYLCQIRNICINSMIQKEFLLTINIKYWYIRRTLRIISLVKLNLSTTCIITSVFCKLCMEYSSVSEKLSLQQWQEKLDKTSLIFNLYTCTDWSIVFPFFWQTGNVRDGLKDTYINRKTNRWIDRNTTIEKRICYPKVSQIQSCP